MSRQPTEVPDLPGYGEELRTQELNPPEPKEPRAYNGPGSYYRWSPDGTLAAVTTEARGHVQTINIWDAKAEQLRPLVSVEEFDPGSGRGYRYVWSRDGKALLIYGHGRLADGDKSEKIPDDRMRLCLVYETRSDTLYRIHPCKPVKWAFG